ncbi:MAG: restriction endonuclease subunit S, partial [Firmicutes bacterium]|nr:restriction endonuclease subunit S [Bacillota bacterium]
PMYEMIASNIIENQSLAKTRDSLLPKLMSGEIDVSDIQL